MAKATVDQNLCVGCGVCVGLCKCFELNAEGKSEFKCQEGECTCDLDTVVASCPVSAIQKTE